MPRGKSRGNSGEKIRPVAFVSLMTLFFRPKQDPTEAKNIIKSAVITRKIGRLITGRPLSVCGVCLRLELET